MKKHIILAPIAVFYTVSAFAMLTAPKKKLLRRYLGQERTRVVPRLPQNPEAFIALVQELTASPESIAQRQVTGAETDTTGTSLFHWSCLLGSPKLASHLLRNTGHALITQQNHEGEGALHFACRGNQPTLVKQLLRETPGVVNESNNAGETPLICSASANNYLLVTLLLTNGADPNRQDKDGASALHWACWHGNMPMVIDLIKSDATIDLISTLETTPLHNACVQGHEDIVSYLLQQGANPNITTPTEGITPLHNAALYGHLGIVKKLVESGARATATRRSSVTPLMNACWKKHHSVVKYLLAQEELAIYLDTQDQHGDTALHYACENNDRYLIHLLLQYGADTDIYNSSGKKPVDLIRRNTQLKKLLNDRQATSQARKKRTRDGKPHNNGTLSAARKAPKKRHALMRPATSADYDLSGDLVEKSRLIDVDDTDWDFDLILNVTLPTIPWLDSFYKDNN